MNTDTLTVSQLVYSIQESLEDDFRNLLVVGEISNLNHSGAGHYYFTLSDKDCSISMALFRFDVLKNPLVKKLKNGDKVKCFGSIGVYSKRGTFQLIVKKIVPLGKGDLKEQFEALKKKLSGEGLFDLSKKKEIPRLPAKIGLVTAKGAAALQDFTNVYARRSLWMDLLLSPSLVQGDKAAASMIKAISLLERYHEEKGPIDIIVLTRGGGSLEDLWAFNDEALARKIFHCKIPIISAVGHEVDYTICDFVADKRAETPTAAAEIISEYQTSIKELIHSQGKTLVQTINYQISHAHRNLERFHPQKFMEKMRDQFLMYKQLIIELDFERLAMKAFRFHEIKMDLEYASQNLIKKNKEAASDRNFLLMQLLAKLETLNPRGVLDRGYTFLTDEKGDVVSSCSSFKKYTKDNKLLLHFKDGDENIRRIE